MSNRYLYAFIVIGLLADVGGGPVIDILMKGLSICEVSDVLTKPPLTDVLDAAMVEGSEMLGGDSIILIGADITIVSGFVVSLSYCVEVLPGTWVGSVMKSIGPRLDVLTDVNNICVVSGIVVDVWTGVDVNVLSVMTTTVGLIAVSPLLE